MAISKVSAYIQVGRLEAVEQRLLELDVPGFSCYEVKGRGHYGNLYSLDGTTKHICVQLFLDDDKVQEVVNGIIEVAHTGVEGDGIVAVERIDNLYHIGSRQALEGDAKT